MPASTADAVRAVFTVLEAVHGVTVVPDVAGPIDLPALVVQPPTISLASYSGKPTGWSFSVALVVRATTEAADELATLIDDVIAAVLASSEAAITADPAPGSLGTPPLPAYLITIEVTP